MRHRKQRLDVSLADVLIFTLIAALLVYVFLLKTGRIGIGGLHD